MHEFPDKPRSSSGLDKLIRKIDDTGGTDYTNGSGRPLSLNPKIGHKTALPELGGLQHFGKLVTKRA